MAAEERNDRVLARWGWGAVALALLVLALPAFGRAIYLHTDLANYFLPIRAFHAACLASGDSCLWFPHFYNGFYLHGDGGAGLFHPLNDWIYRFLPFDVAFNVEFLRPYPVMLAGMYCFLRRWSLPRFASLFGASVFALSGFNLLHHMHMNVLAIAAHLPWLLWAIQGCLRGESARARAGSWFAVALLSGSQWLLGHPQYVVISSLAEAGYAALLVFERPQLRGLLTLLLAKIVGLAIGAVQVVPTLAALSLSARANAGQDLASSYALNPQQLLQLFTPHFLPPNLPLVHVASVYIGAAAPVLLAGLLLRRPVWRPQRTLVFGALGLGGLALILSLGDSGGLYALWSRVPILGQFRAPSRFLLLVHFFVAIAAAVSLSSLVGDPKRPVARRWVLFVVPALSIVVASWLASRPMGPAARTLLGVPLPWLASVGPLCFVLAASLVAFATGGARWAAALLLVLSVADQTYFGWRHIHSVEPRPAAAFLEPPDIPALGPGQRVHWGWPALAAGGISLSSGYAALPAQRKLHFGARFAPGHAPDRPLPRTLLASLRLASVGWMRADSSRAALPDPAAARWREIPETLPRARLVAKAIPLGDLLRQVVRVDLAETAIVRGAIDLEPGTRGSVELLRDAPGAIDLETRSPTRQLLVLSESFHSGWEAEVDGDPCPVLRVYGDFMGCVVEAGPHRVGFRFAPRSLRVGRAVSILGCLSAVLGLVLGIRLGRLSR